MEGCDACEIRGVANAEIESLGADRRKDVRSLTDQRDAVCRKRARHTVGERIDLARAVQRDLAEDGLHALLDAAPERLVVEMQHFLRIARPLYEDEARSVAGQGHERERSVRRMEFRRDIAMRTFMREGENQRRL